MAKEFCSPDGHQCQRRAYQFNPSWLKRRSAGYERLTDIEEGQGIVERIVPVSEIGHLTLSAFYVRVARQRAFSELIQAGEAAIQR